MHLDHWKLFFLLLNSKHAFFISNAWLKLATPWGWTFANWTFTLFCYHTLHPRYYPKIMWYIPKNKQKNNCVYIHDVMPLIIMKMKMIMKNRSYWYDINGPRSRHGHKYGKYKKCFSLMMLICINPLLRNVVKLSDTLQKSCSKCCKIFKVCLIILRHCEVKG